MKHQIKIKYHKTIHDVKSIWNNEEITVNGRVLFAYTNCLDIDELLFAFVCNVVYTTDRILNVLIITYCFD